MANQLVIDLDDPNTPPEMAECKVGDEKNLNIVATATKRQGNVITLSVDQVGYNEEPEEEAEPAAEEYPEKPMKKGVPKAVMIVAGAK